ncbi:hypothetical protein QKV95_gp003 [Poseidoniales virus YSH_150918]|jgi:hypothetical protein|uniref:Uncharacterized protein n=1 Tax=Poseidoniales virus YSH_150918 TaxID=3071324 RepID=A0A976UAY5_9CAUD|nr:hypothetical protein QKV95_gp003 [Yangshan Harbor Poseidoniales virus]UVF62549.1 hypothetical protein [Poseidoniales virus YSH_150918]
MNWEDIVKKPFIYGEDKLPSEEMKNFLMGIDMIISNHKRTDDKELKDLIERLEDFLQLGGPSGKNLNMKDRIDRISGK